MNVISKLDDKETKKGLYLVSTPIGNLKDITLRAIEILKKSDYIICEDTRISQILLKKYEINGKLISNHKFNEKKNLSKIIKLFDDSSIISLISDAGTPCISDPGAILVNECIKNNIKVIPVPGASAVSSALSISGFSEKFFYYGFFPEKKGEIKKILEVMSKINGSLIFFISAKKMNKIVPLLKEYFFDRKIVICREISKLYEEFIRLDIDKLELFKKDLKGELTLVISQKFTKKVSLELSESDKRDIKKMINKFSLKEITKIINKDNKLSKKKIYDYCLKLKNEN